VQRFRVTGAGGETVDVRAYDWMMAMSAAIRVLNVEVSGWVCSSLPDGAMYVADPATGAAWTVERVFDDTPEGALRVVPQVPGGEAAGVAPIGSAEPTLDLASSGDGLATPLSDLDDPVEPPPDLAEDLFDRSFELSSASSPDVAAELALEIVHALVPCEAASVLLGGIDDPALRFAAATGPSSEDVKGKTVPFGQGLVGAAHDLGITIRVADAKHDQRRLRAFDDMTGFTTRNVLCVPMRHAHASFGVLQLLNAPSTFRNWHVEVAEAVAQALGALMAGPE